MSFPPIPDKAPTPLSETIPPISEADEESETSSVSEESVRESTPFDVHFAREQPATTVLSAMIRKAAGAAGEAVGEVAKKVENWAKEIPTKIPGTEKNFKATKALISKRLNLGESKIQAIDISEKWASPTARANDGYKANAQEFCEHGVIVKKVLDCLIKEGNFSKYPERDDLGAQVEKIRIALTAANLDVKNVEEKGGSLLIVLENGKTLKLLPRESEETGIISFKVIVASEEEKTAFRFNYHIKETNWTSEIPAFQYKAKKIFEAALFKVLSEQPVLLGEDKEQLKYVRKLVESAEKSDNSFKELVDTLPIFDRQSILDCQKKYQECLKEIKKDDQTLKEDIQKKAPLKQMIASKIGMEKTTFELRKEVLGDFSAFLESICCTDDESFQKYQEKTFSLIDNKELERVVNIADVAHGNETVTYINSRTPLGDVTIPTTVQDQLGLANYAATSLARYTPETGVVVESNVITHCRPVPIAEQDPALRMAKASRNVLQAVTNQVKQLQEIPDNTSENAPITFYLDVTTLFSPGGFAGFLMNIKGLLSKGLKGMKTENEQNMLAETVLAYESVNNRAILVEIDGKSVWVKPLVTIQNFGINKPGRLDVGVDDALNARGMGHLHAKAEHFFTTEAKELLKDKTAFEGLFKLLTTDEIRDKEEQIQKLEELVYREEIIPRQKELEILYKLLLIPQEEINEALRYDAWPVKVDGDPPLTFTKEEWEEISQNYFPTIHQAPTLVKRLIEQIQSDIQTEVKQLQTLYIHTDGLRRELFASKREEIENCKDKIKEQIKQSGSVTLQTGEEEAPIGKLENLLHALEEYVSFQEAAYLRGPGAGKFGLKIFRLDAKETVLEPAALLNSLNERLGGVPYTFCKSGKDRTGSLLEYINARRIYTHEEKEAPGVLSVSTLSGEKGKPHRLTIIWDFALSIGTAVLSAAANTGGRGLQASGLEWPKPLQKKAKQSSKIAKELGKDFRDSYVKGQLKKYRKGATAEDFDDTSSIGSFEDLLLRNRSSSIDSILSDPESEKGV